MEDSEEKENAVASASQNLVDGNGSSSFPLVWVLTSTEQHGCQPEPALLIEEYESMHLIEWRSSGERDFVESHRVSRSRKRSIGSLGSGSPSSQTTSKHATTSLSGPEAAKPMATTVTCSANRESPSHLKGIDGYDYDVDDDDDDEVQVLLTILPPSPAKPKVSPACTPTSTLSTPNITTPATAEPTALEVVNTTTKVVAERYSGTPEPANCSDYRSRNDDVALNRTLWATTSATDTSSSISQPIMTTARADFAGTSTPRRITPTIDSSVEATTTTSESTSSSSPRKFSSRSSAYLQSLAEICYAILWDVRWRVGGPRQDRLLAWERREDLSAVHALARRYLPVSHPPPISRCQCLLCDQPNVDETDDITDATNGAPPVSLDIASSQEVCSETPTGNPSIADATLSAGSTTMGINEDDEAYDRSLNLYARLYSRKGPWFRVDDLFKYYVPKRPLSDTPAENDSAAPKAPSPAKPTSPSKFFLPKSVKKPSSGHKKPTMAIDSFIDQDFVNLQLEAVGALLQDLQQLFGMGLVRSFESEQECGETVGQVQKYGLLRQEEQRSVLTKLGGTRKQTSRSNFGNNNNGNFPKISAENLIWKQMCQQQSILLQTTSTSPDKPAAVLLPVAKHVDQALIASWATSLVLRASHVDYIPQGLLRSVTTPVHEILNQLLKDHLGPESGISLSCLRLREAPLESVRRCCRVYLCATCGPGEMRGDTGTNAWKALPNESRTKQAGNSILPTNVVAPPGSQNWHHTVYPGRDHRFKLISCLFQRAHQPLHLKSEDDEESSALPISLTNEESQQVQVFPSISSFHLWELSVEIRATVDYLMEANDISLYNERKRAREDEDEKNGSMEENDSVSNEANDDDDSVDRSPLDFLDVLTISGRRSILRRFGLPIAGDRPTIEHLEKRVEEDVGALLGLGSTPAASKGTLKNDCEKILGVIGVIAANILSLRNQKASTQDVNLIASRPWLRHMWWEGCMTYLLWDIIPILERRGFYRLATKALEILLFGDYQPRSDACQIIPRTLVARDGENFLAQAYLSRRARGKAFERLVIDYLHILRHEQKQAVPKKKDSKKRKRSPKEATTDSLATVPSANERAAQLCQELIQSCVSSGQITFCAARTLARRLKQPLSQTLSNMNVYELNELGHRIASDNTSIVEESSGQAKPNGKKPTKKYSDWAPTTDYAVANAMITDGNTVGGRCSFVGFEEAESSGNFGSLNVEELALEYYSSGRLPEQPNKDISTMRGGWVGWHDEGGKLRALFRILSSMTILDADWGCPNHCDGHSSIVQATIHLTPYQGAPFDLHVGAELKGGSNDARLGFYNRRRSVIDKFLTRLEQLRPAEVADLVYRSIAARFQHSKTRQQTDPTLQRDVQQGRTLSAMAAGFGGKMLAALCRCLFFDYRHYSGGLPDLTLLRAVYIPDESHKEESLVDLGSWIGEAFSPDQVAEEKAKSVASMFEDQDEEFLGCSKVGDSGRRNTSRGGRPNNAAASRKPEQRKSEVEILLPEKIVLQHEGRNIRVECMLVEVKSQNDRLDARQEDWLNVLHRYGNVRVCKFGARKKV